MFPPLSWIQKWTPSDIIKKYSKVKQHACQARSFPIPDPRQPLVPVSNQNLVEISPSLKRESLAVSEDSNQAMKCLKSIASSTSLPTVVADDQPRWGQWVSFVIAEDSAVLVQLELFLVLFRLQNLLLFFSEAKCLKNKMNSIRIFLGFDCVVDRVGLSRGLCMFWNNDTDISLLGYSSGHIDVFISLQNSCFCFTSFYGNPKVEFRHFSWDLSSEASLFV